MLQIFIFDTQLGHADGSFCRELINQPIAEQNHVQFLKLQAIRLANAVYANFFMHKALNVYYFFK